MNVLLYDVDGKLPNLALMKLSAYHKAQGDKVGFNIADPDKVYASVILKKHRHMTDGLRYLYPDAEVNIGGPGYDLEAVLSNNIEFDRPDYSIYDGLVCTKCGALIRACVCMNDPTPGNIPYSMGFTTRGCIRKCHFCIVPQKEGHIKQWQHPKAFHDDTLRKIMLLDNNWFADRDWFFETSAWIRDKGLKLREQGMDFRLLDDEIAKRLVELKWDKPMHFAFDNDNDRQVVADGIKLLESHGVAPRHNVRVYVYVHDSSERSLESGIARCRYLKELGTTPLVMFNIDKQPSKEIKQLRRWANKAQLLWSIDIDDYNRKRVHA